MAHTHTHSSPFEECFHDLKIEFGEFHLSRAAQRFFGLDGEFYERSMHPPPWKSKRAIGSFHLPPPSETSERSPIDNGDLCGDPSKIEASRLIIFHALSLRNPR